MNIFLALVLGAMLRLSGFNAPEVRTGKATHYAPLVMNRVYNYRIGVKDISPCPECIGNIALLDEKDINKRAWIIYDGRLIGPLLVIDCAMVADKSRLIKDKWVVDLSYELAEQLDVTWKTVKVTVILKG